MRKRVVALLACFVAIAALLACGSTKNVSSDNNGVGSDVVYGSFTDSRDGQTYKTVKIGNQVWMAENLNYKQKIDAVDLFYGKESPYTSEFRDYEYYCRLVREDYFRIPKWSEYASSFCYGGDSLNCAKYGRIYTWTVANKVCPDGWRLPSRADWDSLIAVVGGKSLAGRALKTANDWFGGGNGTDDYGFSVLPAGIRFLINEYAKNLYDNEERRAFFWSSTERDSVDAYAISLSYYSDSVDLIADYKNLGLSVRCVSGASVNSISMPKSSLQNDNPVETYSAISHSVDPACNRSVAVSNFSITDPRDGQIYSIENIGGQVWMTENLNFRTENSYCYDNHESNCSRFGRLYTFSAAQQACPTGWHLPTENEWETLVLFVREDVEELARNWNFEKKAEFDRIGFNIGFNILPTGSKRANENFRGEGYSAYLWSSRGVVSVAQYVESCCGSRQMGYYKMEFFSVSPKSEDAFSIRCIKDDSIKSNTDKDGVPKGRYPSPISCEEYFECVDDGWDL